jgi:hypothetical protein
MDRTSPQASRVTGLSAWWCGIGCFGADELDDRVFWGVTLLLTSTMTGTIKMIVWSHVERGMLRREIKQVELQVATLSLRLKERP